MRGVSNRPVHPTAYSACIRNVQLAGKGPCVVYEMSMTQYLEWRALTLRMRSTRPLA
jgi:hypothetical protein